MKTVSPCFSTEKASIFSFSKDSAKVEVLVKECPNGGIENDYQPTGEITQKWVKTTVRAIARHWVESQAIGDCDYDVFEKAFGWNPSNVKDEDYDRLVSELPADWQEVYYRHDRTQWTVVSMVTNSSLFEDGEGGGVSAILTPKDARIMRDKHWALKLQENAVAFCAKHKVEMASVEFFNALSREIRLAKSRRDDFFGGEQSAERYATYRASGSSSYFEDNDYMSSKLSKPIQELQELIRFCRIKLPLQYALWKESRIKPK
jgi:hypothetical protein